jgi:DNA-directed RNA polymerase specialized sigma24 family protein
MAVLPPFEWVVREHGPGVWRFCASQVGRDRADDCFQETMLASLRAYPSLRDAGAVRAWLVRIAARTAVDLHRSAARTPMPVGEPDAGAAAGPEPPDGDLWERVRALPAKPRQALALRFVLDLDHRGIAEVMGTTPEAARRSVFEALRTLRARVGADSPSTVKARSR